MNIQCAEFFKNLLYGAFTLAGVYFVKVIRSILFGTPVVNPETSAQLFEQLCLMVFVPIVYAIYQHGVESIIECIKL